MLYGITFRRIINIMDKMADYIVSYGGKANAWFRLWKSGWLEQGYLISSGGSVTINFLKPYKDTTYIVSVTGYGTNTNSYAPIVNPLNSSSCQILSGGGQASLSKRCYVCGFSN